MRRHIKLVLSLALVATLSAPGLVSASTDTTPGQTGFEPTITAFNPLSPNQVAVMRGCTVRISNDFGQTFPVVRNTTLGICNGDPTMAFDSQGRLFVSHLSRSFGAGELTAVVGQVVDLTTPGNGTYTPVQVSATDGNDDDKQWIAADANPTSPYADNLYLIWTRFTGVGNAAGGPTAIMFSRSTDGGANWSAPAVISAGGEGFVWPSHIAVAANGDIYAAYHTNTCGAANSGAIPLLRDGSGGASFAAGTVPQKNNAFAAGQATVTCNVQDGSGDEIPQADFWLQGSVQPWILPDPTDSSSVYVVGNDDPNNAFANGDDGDVVIARSSNFGVSFAISRVDDGPGQTFAVMPTAAIDQDGNIVVTWYDNRRGLMNTGVNSNSGAPNFLVDLYGTTSRDGGASFGNDYRINDSPYDPDVASPCRFGGSPAMGNCTHRIGEYNGVATVDGLAYATWTGNATPPAAPFPSDGAGAQTTYYDLHSMAGAFADSLEPNESIDFAVVANLGVDHSYIQADLTLHSSTDVDFFEVEALETGKLVVEAQFNEVVAQLDVLGFDSSGSQIASGSLTTVQPGSSSSLFAIPVVAGETYFVQVLDPNAPGTFPPQSSYDLSIVNTEVPVPFGIDLVASSDSGRSALDNVTNDSTPTLRVQVDDGDFIAMGVPFEVVLFDNGTQLGVATAVPGQPGVYEFTPAGPLTDGSHFITARTRITDDAGVSAFGEVSDSLQIVIDTSAPAAPSEPDLLASSDTGGVDIDNITTIQGPAFDGTAEANSLLRLLADGVEVGQSITGTDASDGVSGDGDGRYQVTSDDLTDGVYDITATAEDLAGNISGESSALAVTIAHESLSLNGASGDVTVDLDALTVTGYPGIPGGVVGIAGIPVVNLDANGNGLAFLGTASDDSLTYMPTGAEAGTVTRDDSTQVINFTSVAGILSVDPLAGTDAVSVLGTPNADAITATGDTTSTVQVNATKLIEMPAASVEEILMFAGNGQDVIDITIMDTVAQFFTVDGGAPSSNPKNGDALTVIAGSPQAKVQKQSSPVKGSGSVFVDYFKTTLNVSRVDYVGIEKIATDK